MVGGDDGCLLALDDTDRKAGIEGQQVLAEETLSDALQGNSRQRVRPGGIHILAPVAGVGIVEHDLGGADASLDIHLPEHAGTSFAPCRADMELAYQGVRRILPEPALEEKVKRVHLIAHHALLHHRLWEVVRLHLRLGNHGDTGGNGGEVNPESWTQLNGSR